MNLDDLTLLHQIDSQDLLGQIDRLPEQLAAAWDLGQQLPLPSLKAPLHNIIICGMGAAANAAELLAAYVADLCPMPVIVHRDYGLPAFAHGPQTLVIGVSYSGETEETLDAFSYASAAGCTLLALSAGGRLADKTAAANLTVWNYAQISPPRGEIGAAFGLLLALFARLGLIPDQTADIIGALVAMRTQQEKLVASVPAALNPAKRYAGQLVGRWVTVFGAGVFAPLARRWKTQLNLLAKAPASFETLPEADHNALAGLANPADLLMSQTLTLFITAPSDHPRNRLRSDLTRQAFMLEGLNTDFYLARGETRLAQLWTTLQFGDYLAFYLALAYQTDPSQVETLAQLKDQLADG